MLNFPNDRIPLRISLCPIIDAVLEIRYLPSIPLEVMIGMIYEKLQQRHKDDSSIQLGQLQRLPVNDIPIAVRNSDENLKNQPHYIVDYNGLSFRFAMNNVSMAIKGTYLGWDSFRKGVKDIIAAVNLLDTIKAPLRIGLRYTSFFSSNIFEQTKLELKLFGNETLQANNAIFTNWNDGDLSCSLQIANNVIVSNDKQTKQGSIIDVDVATKDAASINVTRIDEILEDLHNYEKKVFFNLLADTLLETLNPVYN